MSAQPIDLLEAGADETNTQRIRDVVECVARLYRIPPDRIAAGDERFVQPLHLAMYLARKTSMASNDEIANAFGTTPHVVAGAVQLAEVRAKNDPKYRARLDAAEELARGFELEAGEAHLLAQSAPPPSLRLRSFAGEMKAHVAEVFGVTIADIDGPSRSAEYVPARAFTMYLSMRLCGMSASDAARFVNRKDHTTALYHASHIEEKMAQEPAYRALVEQLAEGSRARMLAAYEQTRPKLEPARPNVQAAVERAPAEAPRAVEHRPLHAPAAPAVFIEAVAEAYQIAPAKILSTRHEYAAPRQLAMYLVRKHTSLSYPNIGRVFNRHHSTVINAYERVETSLREDLTLAHAVRAIEVKVGCKPSAPEDVLKKVEGQSGLPASGAPARLSSPAKIAIDHAHVIKDFVACQFGQSGPDLDLPNRGPYIAHIRHTAMFVVRETTGASYPQLAEVFKRETSSTRYGVESVAKQMKENPEYAKAIDKLVAEAKLRFAAPSLLQPSFGNAPKIEMPRERTRVRLDVLAQALGA
jgi:chromosomal replication initiation ATPase DnaA